MTFAEGKPVRFEEDTNFDGRIDLKGLFDSSGEVASEERDTNGDGLFDLRITYSGGQKTKEERDTRDDGKPDVITSFEHGLPRLTLHSLLMVTLLLLIPKLLSLKYGMTPTPSWLPNPTRRTFME